MNSLTSLCFFSALGLLASLTPSLAADTPSTSPKSSTKKPPNILLIITDDHSTQALGTNEKDSPVPLPSLHKLGKQGMVFDKSFCCNSICGPSRAAIMTGRHSHKNGFVSNEYSRFDGSQPTFPKLLQKNGYETGYLGKWHLNSTPVGFNSWEILPNQGSYYNPDFIQMDGKQKRFPGYVTDIITEKSLDWLNKRDKTKPFMLVVGHKAPHRLWAPALRHLGKVDGKKLTPPATLFDDYKNRPEALSKNEQTIAKHLTLNSDLKILGDLVPEDSPIKKRVGGGNGEINRMDPAQKEEFRKHYAKRTAELAEGLKPGGKLTDPKALTEWKWRAYMEDYLSCLLSVDDSIGTLLNYLDKEGLSEDTLVVYCGDQSFYLGEHGMYDKRWVFEESLKMPLIMRWKGKITPGVRSEALVQNIDYAPTFAEIAGISPEETRQMGFQGQSLTPLFKSKGKTPKNWRDLVYYAYYEWPAEHNCPRHDAIRTEDFTLAYMPYSKEWMLFDLKKDPQQMRNVAEDPAYKKTFDSLKKRYEKTRAFYQVDASLPGDTKERPKLVPSW